MLNGWYIFQWLIRITVGWDSNQTNYVSAWHTWTQYICGMPIWYPHMENRPEKQRLWTWWLSCLVLKLNIFAVGVENCIKLTFHSWSNILLFFRIMGARMPLNHIHRVTLFYSYPSLRMMVFTFTPWVGYFTSPAKASDRSEACTLVALVKDTGKVAWTKLQ